MPFARVTVGSSSTMDAKTLAQAVSTAVAGALGKPEQYMVVAVETPAVLLFGGTDEPAAMVNVESIGGSCSKVAAAITKALVDAGLGIVASRVYVNFTGFTASEWAMAGSTFG
jgi:phenylpyruvate tautomerase